MNPSKTIGIFHFKIGGTDGVSLEIEKWKHVLEEMGHTVHLCAGDLGAVEGVLIEEMYHHIPEIERLNRNTFSQLRDFDEAGYKAELDRWTNALERRFRDFIVQKGIDFIIPQNVWSVAASPPVAVALERVRRELGIPALAHNHDFYWERVDGVALTCAAAVELADKYLPPRDPKIKHVVINSLAQRELAARKGIQASVVPNIFDFDAPPWGPDDYSRDFRERIGLKENDVFILQATRIVPRKGIELAVDFVKALGAPARRAQLNSGLYDGRAFTGDSRIVLVLAGYAQDDLTGRYLNQLKTKAQREGVDALFVDHLVGGGRGTRNGNKIYSLWDTYVFADFVTYPSLWEGWGNQLLETLRARLPMMLFEYPVYRADIQDKGFRFVSLGGELSGRDARGLAQVSPEIIESAADQAVELLTNPQLRAETVEHNFRTGRKHYSLAALRGHLTRLMAGTFA
ncbi:MAG: glycosyl transferase family 1 [Anaerolineales bacterium]